MGIGGIKVKTVEEIREKLEIYKKIRDNAPIFSSEFTIANGAIAALEYVLEDNEDVENNKL